MMKKKIFFLVALFSSLFYFSQTGIVNPDLVKPNPEKEKKFAPYLAVRHGGMLELEKWRQSNTVQYYKELWYFCESFYVKRDNSIQGIMLDESIIDIARFEYLRKENEEQLIELPGFKDALVLLPRNKLIYVPDYAK